MLCSACILLMALAAQWQLYRRAVAAGAACSSGAKVACVQELTAAARWQVPFRSEWENAALLARRGITDEAVSDAVRMQLLWELRAAVYGSRSILRPETPLEQSALLRDIDAILPFSADSLQLESRSNYSVKYRWQLFAQGFFWAWILCAILSIFRGMTMSGNIESKQFFPYIAAALLAFVGWIVCLTAA